MKILLVKSRLPYPIRAGEDLVDYGLIKALAEKHEITLIAPVSNPSETMLALTELEKYCRRIIPVNIPHDSKVIKRLRQEYNFFIKKIPLEVSDNSSAVLLEAICRVLENESFDLCEIEYWFLGDYARRIPAVCPTVLLEINSIYIDWQRASVIRPMPIRRYIRNWFYTHTKLSEFEAGVCRLFDWVLFLSSADLEVVKSNGGINNSACVIPIPYPIRAVSETKEKTINNGILFIGGMRTPYNIDSVRYFCREILPLIKLRIPNANFTVIGTLPDIKVYRELEHLGVKFSGFQKDLYSHMRTFDVLVAPVKCGSGVRTKIIEAFSQGMAVVSTSMGIEGLLVSPGEDLLVSDTPEEFAASVIRLLTDNEFRWRISSCALERFKGTYSYKVVSKSTIETYEMMYEKIMHKKKVL